MEKGLSFFGKPRLRLVSYNITYLLPLSTRDKKYEETTREKEKKGVPERGRIVIL